MQVSQLQWQQPRSQFSGPQAGQMPNWEVRAWIRVTIKALYGVVHLHHSSGSNGNSWTEFQWSPWTHGQGRAVAGGPWEGHQANYTQCPDTSSPQPWPVSRPDTERDASTPMTSQHLCSYQVAQSLQMDFATVPSKCKLHSLHNRHKCCLTSSLQKK